MTTMTQPPNDTRRVFGGVDTHKDVHVAATLDHLGRLLGTESFPTTAAGYRQLSRWLRSHGDVVSVGVEGTGSWGAGLARSLTADGVDVREVMRPNRQHRRRHGKSDEADASAPPVRCWRVTPSAHPSRRPVRSKRSACCGWRAARR
jgi:transposase